jgi:hypothetical protein
VTRKKETARPRLGGGAPVETETAIHPRGAPSDKVTLILGNGLEARVVAERNVGGSRRHGDG